MIKIPIVKEFSFPKILILLTIQLSLISCTREWNNPLDHEKTTTGNELLIPEGLVAYYPFDGNAEDESGKGNHGIVNGATLSSDRFGNENSAYYFDGVDDYINLGNNGSLDLYDQISISAWIIKYQSSSGWEMIINKDPAGSVNNDWFLGTNYDRPVFRVTTSDYYDLFAGITLTTNDWFHLAGTYNGAEMKIYVNGVEEGSRQFTGNIKIDSTSVFIGAATGSTEYSFTGSIDDVRVYDRLLSLSEINQLYNE